MRGDIKFAIRIASVVGHVLMRNRFPQAILICFVL